MDSMSAFAMGEAYRGHEPMVFDWDKAARIIKERKKERKKENLKQLKLG